MQADDITDCDGFPDVTDDREPDLPTYEDTAHGLHRPKRDSRPQETPEADADLYLMERDAGALPTP